MREDVSLGVAEVAALTLAAPLALALTMLFAWHCYLVSRNKTTIEHYEGVRAAAGAEAASTLPPLHATDGEPRHPYSLGLRANLREILGPRVLCWLAPGCSIAGDGLAFANVAEYGKWKRARARKEEELTLS
jgi:palmitoyltransferase